MIPIIDTHQHLWELERFALPWLDGFTALKHDYPMRDYVAQTTTSGVEATVYMEVDARPDQHVAEARYAASPAYAPQITPQRADDRPAARRSLAGRAIPFQEGATKQMAGHRLARREPPG